MLRILCGAVRCVWVCGMQPAWRGLTGSGVLYYLVCANLFIQP